MVTVLNHLTAIFLLKQKMFTSLSKVQQSEGKKDTIHRFSVDGRSVHKEIDRICIWLSGRAELKGKVKAVGLQCFPKTGYTLWALKKHHFIFFRIRSAAARMKVSGEGSLARILET